MESLSKRLLQECDQTAALMEEDAVSSGTGMTGFDDSDSASTMSDLTTGTDSASIHMLVCVCCSCMQSMCKHKCTQIHLCVYDPRQMYASVCTPVCVCVCVCVFICVCVCL